MTLDQLPVGHTARVTRVGGEGALRYRLLDMGIITNTQIRVVKIAPLGDPMELWVRGYSLSVRKADAALIEIQPLTYGKGEEAPV